MPDSFQGLLARQKRSQRGCFCTLLTGRGFPVSLCYQCPAKPKHVPATLGGWDASLLSGHLFYRVQFFPVLPSSQFAASHCGQRHTGWEGGRGLSGDLLHGGFCYFRTLSGSKTNPNVTAAAHTCDVVDTEGRKCSHLGVGRILCCWWLLFRGRAGWSLPLWNVTA